MSLVSRVSDVVIAIREKFNSIMPRLVPPGGTVGQVVTKTGTSDYIFGWQTPSSGAGLSDGDKGDITVSQSGSSLTVDPHVKYGLPIAMSKKIFFN